MLSFKKNYYFSYKIVIKFADVDTQLQSKTVLQQALLDRVIIALNLEPSTPKWLNQVHMEAWKRGVKTLYYMRTESVLRGDIAAAAMDPSCVSCDG